MEMTDKKHSPGPWRITDETGTTEILSSDGKVIISDETYYPSAPDNDADWHLIAAAPDLLEALQAMLDLQDNASPFGGEMYQDRVDRVFGQCRAAIAKARGQSK